MLKIRLCLFYNFFTFTLFFFMFTACFNDSSEVSGLDYTKDDYIITEDFSEEPDELITARLKAMDIAALMDDSQLAAQCLLTGLDSNNFLSRSMRDMLSNYQVGGIMYFRHNLAADKDEVRSFLHESALVVFENTGIVPFIAVDHEGGLVHRFGQGVLRLPSAYHFWNLAQNESTEASLLRLEELVLQSAMEIRELGITMNLAPVAEVLSEENRVFLETRAYGPDPLFVEMAASAFINAMDMAGIASVVKHFPGNSAEDPHFTESIISSDYNELLSMTEPFRGIIRNISPSSIMISHSIVGAIDPQSNASLSPPVIKWLRDGFGFQGIVMADDFRMRAVTTRGISSEQAAVIALNAGVDMIMCWPHNISSVHKAILDALDLGNLSRERLLDAVTRILTEKIRYGLL